MHPSRQHVPWPLVIVLVLLLAAGLRPLHLLPVTAQPLCVGDTIWDAEAGECVDLASPTATQAAPEPTPTATMPEAPDPIATETDAPDIDGGDEEVLDNDTVDIPTATSMPDDARRKSHGYPMRLTFYTFECPWNLDIASVSQGERMDRCGGFLGGATYSLDIDGYSYGPAISPPSTGGTGWTDIDPGLATVVITPPANFTNPSPVYCSTSTLVADPPIETMYTGPNGLEGFRLQLEQDDIWYCSVYFRAAADGSITLDVRRCPDGMDIYNTSPATLADTCLV